MAKNSHITITDMFCGAGGSSQGATSVKGVELKMAMNHWPVAIATHNENFPHAGHDCSDISATNPRRYPSTIGLIASPECTNHAMANGKKKPTRQMDLFNSGAPDPAEERSRATMWDVPRFAEVHQYQFCVIENVVEARNWVMWDAWIHSMDLLGYEHECVYLNSMHTHPTPQSRDRMYVVFWKKGNKRPNLQITPKAYCPHCEKDVRAVQAWKKPQQRWGRYRKQYLYCCPKCSAVVEPYYYAAANAIDWSLPTQKIGDRVKPLKEATLRRIKIGLEKFGTAPQYISNYTPGYTKPMTQALGALTTADHHAWLLPFVMNTQFTHSRGNRSYGVEQALPTQTAQQAHALIMPPFLASYYGTNQGSELTEAMPAVTTHDRHGLVVPPFLYSYYTRLTGQQSAVHGFDEPLPTVPGRATHYVVQPPPFILNMQNNSSPTQMHEAMATLLASANHKWVVEPPPFITNLQADNPPTGMSEPMPTVLTGERGLSRNHKYLTTPPDWNAILDECGFRMLEPNECKTAMAFPADYRVTGNKREQIKQWGNAVTPPAMELLAERVVATLR